MDKKEIEALKKKNLCHQCVGERFLGDEIRVQGKKVSCSYCGRITESYRISQIAERMEEVFKQHFFRTSDQPTDWQYSMLKDKELSYDWERDGERIIYAIMNAANIPEAAANDIQQILEEQYSDFDAAVSGEETEFSSDSYYQEKEVDDWHWQKEWREFERSMKSEARFFNREAANHLKKIFDGIDQMKTQDDRSLIIDAGPATSFTEIYRARVFQADDKIKEALIRPDLHLGSPPSKCANAGRMNAHGISVFYGANDPRVALAEVRPPVGSRVAVARFEIVKPLRLLDLTALSAVSTTGSIFDPAFAGLLERVKFLRSLSERITKPVMPDDEPFEYIVTQAVADFLANESTMQIDGIMFPSVQTAGLLNNIVLFHKSAKVKQIDLPKGTEIEASRAYEDEDGSQVYSVVEKVPPEIEKDDEKTNTQSFENLPREDVGDLERQPSDNHLSTLRIDLNSVMVHTIMAVEFTTEDHKVSRDRWEMKEGNNDLI